MVKRTNTNVAREIIKKNRSAVPEYTSNPQRNQRQTHTDDDLIVLLGDSHENKRARQVVEWERTQYANVYRSV